MKQFHLLIFILSMAVLPQFSYAAAAARTAETTISTTTETKTAVKSLSKNERKALRKSKRAERKSFKQKIKNAFKKIKGSISLLLLIIITVLLPWLGVLLHEGSATKRFWISLVLWLLFYFPGLIYALIVILGDN